jgi:hypothetical protein
MWWWTIVGCFSDPLSAIAPVAEVPPAPEPAPLEVPTTPPMDGAKITGDGAPAEATAGSSGGGAVASGEPTAKPPAEYNPISVPQGPRESGGVKWEGVTKRGANAPLREANGSAEYEESFGKN